jgi:mannose-6-phosphate isomerase
MTFTPPESPHFRTQREEKPWGHEVLWAWGPGYVGKLLHVRQGEALSLQYHERKDETLSVLSGRVRLEHGLSEHDLAARELGPGDCFRVMPGTRHRITALEDAVLLEASTTDLDDVVRISDRYGRDKTR